MKQEKHQATVQVIVMVVVTEYVKQISEKLFSPAQKTVELAVTVFATSKQKILVCVLKTVDIVEMVSVMLTKERTPFHVPSIVVQLFAVMVFVLLVNQLKPVQLIVPHQLLTMSKLPSILLA